MPGLRVLAAGCLVGAAVSLLLFLGSASPGVAAATGSNKTILPFVPGGNRPHATSTPAATATPAPTGTAGATATPTAAPTTPLRRVNVPAFDSTVDPAQAAVFWFGRVDDTSGYADVRLGYTSSELYVNVTAIDRRLWYQSGLTAPSPALTTYDSASLFLNLTGNSGSAPTGSSYRFDGGLSWWETARTAYQASFVGTRSAWVPSLASFATESGWRGNAPNDDLDDKGWTLTYHIPFSSLGLSGPPTAGTIWGLGVQLHNRDDGVGTAIADQVWPAGLAPTNPASWGQLRFGLPTYTSTPTATGSTTVRQGLDGASVPDGQVGGYTDCGAAAASTNYFPTWGGLSYPGYANFNVQNESDVSDWPCFSRTYVSFPLTGVPAGKTIVSAQLTLHQFGGSGNGDSSLVQVFTVDQAWDPASLTWNNAPPARENVSQAWVAPLPTFPGWPGVARQWDLGYAVAQAYAAGDPVLRLAVYTADTNYNSGKYFVSSETGDWNAAGRPTLQINWAG